MWTDHVSKHKWEQESMEPRTPDLHSGMAGAYLVGLLMPSWTLDVSCHLEEKGQVLESLPHAPNEGIVEEVKAGTRQTDPKIYTAETS